MYFDELSSLQIIYVVNGEIHINIHGEYKIFKKGQMCILNQFESKFIYSKYESLLLITKISSEYLKNIGDDYYSARFNNTCETNSLDELLYNILNLYKTSKDISDEENNMNIVHNIINILLESCINKDKDYSNIKIKSSYLKEIEEYIYEDYGKDLTLKDLSNMMHVSISYLSKTFNELTGIRYSEYIQQLKLYYSITYILNTKNTIEDIADIVGFESIKSINRIFKRYLDIQPSVFRKKYWSENSKELEEDEDFLSLLKKYQIINYQKFIENNCSKDINNFNIKLDSNKKYKTFENWKIIKNLKSLGENYIKTLNDILNQFTIKEIIVKFKYKNNKLYLVDFNREVNYYELNEFFNKCIEYDVNLVLELKFDDYDSEIINTEILEIKKNLCYQFLNSLSMSVGITNIKKFTYLIDISDITKFLDRKDDLDKYIESIYYQENVLKDVMGGNFYNWGFEVGEMTVEKLDEMNQIAEIFKNKKFKNPPEVISMIYRDEYLKNITDIRDLNKIRNRFTENRRKLTNIVEKFSFNISKLYINDLFYNIDISEINYLYSDLLIVSILMESLYEADKDINYITEYKVRDKNKKDGVYYPIYKDKNGFFTPLYWISLLLDSIDGDLIHKESGCFVTKNDEDIYILLYGDIVSDYSFSQKKGIENLENEYRNVNLNISGLDGKYKIVTERLSFENGTSGYYLKYFEDYKYLTNSEREYIKRVAIPKLYMNLKNIKGDFVNSIKMAPFEVVLQKYIKV